MSQAYVDLTQRGFQAFNDRDLDALLATLAEDVEAFPLLASFEGSYRGHDGVRRWWEGLLDAFPDFRVEALEMRDLGDRTMAVVRVQGRGAGSETPFDGSAWYLTHFRDGWCVAWNVYMSEREALEAAAGQPGPLSPEYVEGLVRWGYDWFNREREPPPSWLSDGEFINAREDPDHATHRGIEAIRAQHRGWFDSYPDLRVEPREIRANGDRVFVWVHFSGQGADSGAPMEMELAHVLTLQGGGTRRLEEYFDRAEALAAVGLPD